MTRTTLALLLALALAIPSTFALPTASAGAPDDACDPTGLVVCAEVGEQMLFDCGLTPQGARCILYREAFFIAGSPIGLPGYASAVSGGSGTACVGEVCEEQAILDGTFDCSWTAGFSCLVHATMLPHVVGPVPLAPGECLEVELETDTRVTAYAVLGVPPMPGATATTGALFADTVCA